MFRTVGIAFLFVSFSFFSGVAEARIDVRILESPNKEFSLRINIGPMDQISGYVSFKGKRIVELRNFGFLLESGEIIPSPQGSIVVPPSLEPREVRGSWNPPYGERDTIPDNYNELIVEYKGLMKIIFRAYDEGVAFHYEFETKENEPIKIKQELTTFTFAGDYLCWAVYTAQGIYEHVPLSKVKKGCERPLVVEVTDGPVVAIGEARLVDFARMKFDPNPDQPTSLVASLYGEVVIQGTGKPYRSPWRFVMAADQPGTLVEHNYLLLNLNDPSEIADTSWIKPGKVFRDVTLTTVGGKASVDFAVDRGIQYIIFDAGWYGPEHRYESDATYVSLDPARNPVPDSFDLHAVIEYANSKGVGVILYVNRRALEQQLDDILPLYKEWGVAGIKYGFVQVGSQQWTTWLHDAIAKTAKYELVVDVHDEYRGTGWERTYPNLLTVEGVRGNEERMPAWHACVTALTRMIAGAADHTHCWYTDINQTRPTYHGTRTHQLATVVVLYSPLQFLFWYDRPRDFKGEPELDFWKTIPTVWDDTRVLHGEIGKLATFARRTGDEWYVGTISAGERRTLKLPLDFLEKGKEYTATIYSDDESDRLKVHINQKQVNAGTVLDLNIAPDGGAALRIVPR